MSTNTIAPAKYHKFSGLCRCDNCGFECFPTDLDNISDLYQRVTPGGTMPAGQCPQCNALSYSLTDC